MQSRDSSTSSLTAPSPITETYFIPFDCRGHLDKPGVAFSECTSKLIAFLLHGLICPTPELFAKRAIWSAPYAFAGLKVIYPGTRIQLSDPQPFEFKPLHSLCDVTSDYKNAASVFRRFRHI